MAILTAGAGLGIIGLKTRQHKAQRLQPWELWTKGGGLKAVSRA
ncbi:hypothetical protein BH23VER1_BH23VER1_07580 [soil metagenome]